MASPDPRSETTTSEGFTELQPNLDILTHIPTSGNDTEIAEDVHHKIHAGHCIRQVLLANPNTGQARDQFRVQHGFHALLTAMANLVHLDDRIGTNPEQSRPLLDYLQVLFGILSAALQDHRGNQRFFRKRVDGGGWQSLQRLLIQLLTAEKIEFGAQREVLTERALGCLLACGLNDELAVPLFSKLRNLGTSIQDEAPQDNTTETSQVASPKKQESPSAKGNNEEPATQKVLGKDFDSFAVVYYPEALSVMFELWKTLKTAPHTKDDRGLASCQEVPSIIKHLADLSARNQQAMHTTSLLSSTLSCLLSSSLRHDDLIELRSLAVSLLQMGVTNLNDAHLLYRQAASSTSIADLLFTALRLSHSPPYVQFDLSAHGYVSVELPGLGRVFPPVSSSAGYTLTLWFYVVHFDPKAHTTLFGAFDSSQTCFMLVYLEGDTQNLILQTSVKSSRPSVRFKSLAFQPEHWYHIAIVHRRPSTTMSSRASLFVDGVFIEQVKSNYPATPPSMAQTAGRSRPVQAFLGTPQDLAERLGKGLIFSQWRFASAHLFGQALSDDLVAMYHGLGPKYNGNYQDRLGSFQTYEASAALNLHNESLHPGKEEKSDIIVAIRQLGSALMPESQILLNISPVVVLDDDEANNINEMQLRKGLGKQASKTLRNVTRGRNPLAINGAIPAINEALQHSPGFAVLTGDPVVVVPQSLDDAAWRVGGCAKVCLSLVEAADSHVGITSALSILFESIKGSWRNSEAMERENGFGVLATLLSKKLDQVSAPILSGKIQLGSSVDVQDSHEKLCLEVLSTILEFLGYKPGKPRESVINNPLAYRILIVDPDLWRKSYPAVQRLYYKQFVIFGANSRYHLFNTKRLSKMRECFAD